MNRRQNTSRLAKPVIIAGLSLYLGLAAYGQEASGSKYHLLVGTYTAPGKSEGIYVYEFDSDTGETKYKTVAGGIPNPSFLTVSDDHKFVYSVNEEGSGGVSSFGFDPKTGTLKFINRVGSGGNGPCYISVDRANKFVYVGNYGGGSLAAIPIRPNGALGYSIQSIRHEGHSTTPNQKQSHVHATVLSGKQDVLYVTDLGNDKIYRYKIDTGQPNPLTSGQPPYLEVPPGSGPRHLALHPNAKYIYVIHELTGQITVLSVAGEKLKAQQTVELLPSDFKGGKYEADAADIHISPDGKFLYGSLRGSINELVLFEIRENGTLEYRNRFSTGGKTPRNFIIDPTGNFLLVGNAGTHEITIFKRDKKTGDLLATGKNIQVGSPVCLKFVPID